MPAMFGWNSPRSTASDPSIEGIVDETAVAELPLRAWRKARYYAIAWMTQEKPSSPVEESFTPQFT